MNPQCSVALLESALARSLSAEEEASFERHLEECDACSAALEQMAGGTEWCREAAALLAEDELDAAVPTRDEWSEVDFTVEHLEPADEPNVLGRLGGYDVLEIIGHGGMGVVLKGFDRELKRSVAIKVLAPHLARSSLARKRFAREAQAAAAVVHPHVLAIHQVQPGGRLPFLVMPLVAGESLAERLTALGTLELKEILRIGMQAAAGLAAAHEQGLVHRDVKPANILLEKGVERAVLTDFGLACAADDVTLTRWGTIAGTPQYMSPEQARGKPLDGRSDLFSLGCVLYEMATGVSPFRADSIMATMRRLVDDPPQAMSSLNSELPPWFVAIVDRLLEKEPARRFNSAQEVSQLLEGCLAHVQQPASVALPAGLPKPKVRRGWRSDLNFKGVLTMIGTLTIGLLGILLATANPPDIVGEWTGEEWGTVALKKISDTEYAGTYSDTFGKKPGEIHLKWSRIERRFNGTWREGQALAFSADAKTLAQSTDRFGELSVRLVDNEIRGAFSTDLKSTINPATPRLADLTWRRVVLSKSFKLQFEGVEAAPALPYPLDNISGKIEMRVGSPDDRADRFLHVVATMQPPVQVSHVWAETNGTISEVLASLGHRVEAGQAMVRLNSTDEQEQVDAQQSLVRQFSANLVTLKAAPRQASKRSIDIARAELDKVRARTESARVKESYTVKLREDKVVSSGEVTTVRAELRAAEADEQIAQARLDALLEQPADRDKEIEETTAQLESAKTQLAESRKLLAGCTIRSPIEGIVISLHAVPDQLVAPQSKPGAKELFEVTSTHAIDIRAQIPPAQASQIDPGEDIEVQFDHQGTTVRWTGHIVLPDPEQVGNPLVVRVANPDWRLYRAGATVTLRFKLRAATPDGGASVNPGGLPATNRGLAITDPNTGNTAIIDQPVKVQPKPGAAGTPPSAVQKTSMLKVLFATPASTLQHLRRILESQGALADSRQPKAHELLDRLLGLFVDEETQRKRFTPGHPRVEQSTSKIVETIKEILELSGVDPSELTKLMDDAGGARSSNRLTPPLPAPSSAPMAAVLEAAISELQHAEVYVQQQKANLQFAEADLMRAGAKLSRSKGEGEEIETSYQELLRKYQQKLVEKRLVDKSTQQRNAAQAAEQTARAEFNAAQAKHEAAKDRLRRAETELHAARQKVQAATAQSGGGTEPLPASGAPLKREGATKETLSPRSGSSSLGTGSSSVSNPPASDKHAFTIVEAELEKARAAVESARANAARMAELAKQQSVNESLVDEAEAKVRMAEADEKAAKARLDSLREQSSRHEKNESEEPSAGQPVPAEAK